MSDYAVTFTRGFSLNEALAMIEDDEEFSSKVKSVTIFPPENACDDLTDEDSGNEDFLTLNNLPGSQLNALAEIEIEGDESDDDNLPLSVIQKMCIPTENTERKENHPSTYQPENEILALQDKEKRSQKSLVTKRRTYEWEKADLQIICEDFMDFESNTRLPDPLDIFSMFFDEDIFDLIVHESNRYAQQKNRHNTIQKSEVKSFIGILILSGYIQVPRRRMYWQNSEDSHHDLVSEAISRDKFEYILSNFHVTDNDHLNADDKFAKVRPLFSHLNKKFMEQAFIEEMHSVDEAMVPYYGRHGCKQFIHGKPIRYGYKLWVGTTRLGYINWFEPYQGSATNISKTHAELGVGAGVVLEYTDALREKWPEIKFHIYFDNFFTSLPLIEELSKNNFHATGTVRENRLPGNRLVDTKMMKKQKRGSYDYQKVTNQNIIAVKWHDNSVVTVCSNFAGIQPLHSVKRYSQKEKKTVQVEQPHLIHLYNNNMGGVYRSDQNISLYRVSVRGKKWYFSLVRHCVDMAIQNSWHIHKHRGGILDQLSFRRRIATILLTQNKKKYTYQTGRPSVSQATELRYDRLDHLVIPQENQTRCGECHNRAKTRCSECNIGLHVKCFQPYYTKKPRV